MALAHKNLLDAFSENVILTTMISVDNINALVSRCRHHGAGMVALFGSTSRKQDTLTSDVDILVRFEQPKSLIAFSGLQRELSEIIQRPVDLVTEDSLSPYIRDKVLSEMTLLYGSR